MRNTAWILIAALSLGCSSTTSEPAGPIAATVTVGDSFTLRAGETVQLAGEQLQVAFRRVEGDSRCPQDVTCVWAGDAVVRLEAAYARTAWVPVQLHTTLEPRRAEQFGYNIELLSLTPEPKSGQQIADRDYVASLRITRR